MAQQLLVARNDDAATEPLAKLATSASRPATRMQALCTLGVLEKLPNALIIKSLSDSHPGVRRQAIRLAESRLDSSPEILAYLTKLVEPDANVALQLACTLGATADPQKINALAKIAARHGDDTYLLTGIMSSIKDDELGPLLRQVFANTQKKPSAKVVKTLMELAGAANDKQTVVTAFDLATAEADRERPPRFDAIDSLLAGIRRNRNSKSILGKDALARLDQLSTKCVGIAKDDKADVKTRVDCIRVLGRSPQASADNVKTLAEFLSADHDSQVQLAAVDAMAERSQPAVADHLLSAWRSLTPTLRTRVLDVLLTRKQWVGPLLAA